MNILITGGLGYIGSHLVVEFSDLGHRVVILDNLSNSEFGTLERIHKIIGHTPKFFKGDICDQLLIERILSEEKIEVVVHLAGLKAVSSSARYPLDYYQNNFSGTLNLLQSMKTCNVKKFVFSSSATVYGLPQYLPLDESHPTNPTNPYGRTKLQVENLLRDVACSDSDFGVVVLRYFNPVGAHDSGLIGECPNGIPSNLVPYIGQVATRKIEKLQIFGGDYPTLDGTGIRDYIHVVDLAEGHSAALNLFSGGPGFHVLNLGTGVGYSVYEILKVYSEVSHRDIPYEVVGRRGGDVSSCFADPGIANKKLGWFAKRSLEKMCQDAWNWELRNS